MKVNAVRAKGKFEAMVGWNDDDRKCRRWSSGSLFSYRSQLSNESSGMQAQMNHVVGDKGNG